MSNPDDRESPTIADMGQTGPDLAATDAVDATEPADDLTALKAERDEALEAVKRAKADFYNYQSRVRRDQEAERRYAAAPLLGDLLPVLDNLERALDAAKGQPDATGLLAGLDIVRRQFGDAFRKHGVEPIRPDGQPFDPNQHNAIMRQPSADVPPMTVLHTVQSGYRLHDRVIRPAQVVVAVAAG